MNKQEFLRTVYENEAIKKAMSQLKKDSERQATEAAINEMLGIFYDRVTSVATFAQNNLNDIKNAVSEIDTDVITDRVEINTKTTQNG